MNALYLDLFGVLFRLRLGWNSAEIREVRAVGLLTLLEGLVFVAVCLWVVMLAGSKSPIEIPKSVFVGVFLVVYFGNSVFFGERRWAPHECAYQALPRDAQRARSLRAWGVLVGALAFFVATFVVFARARGR